jgi:outer membrane protein
MRKTKLAAAVAATLAASLSMLLPDAHALDLLQAYSQAQAYDSQFASARAAHIAGAEKSAQGLSGLLPAIGLSGSATQIDSSAVNYKSNNLQLQLKQPLYNPASFDAYEQSKLQVAASEIQFAQAQNDLALRVAQAYFDVLAAQDATIFIQAQKAAIAEQLESAKRNFEVGTATITDTHEAQARFDLTLAQEIAAQNDLEVKRNALAQVTGQLPAELAGLKTGVTLSPPEPAKPDEWVSGAQTNNFNVTLQQLAVEIARRDITRNRASHLPTVDFIASEARMQGLAYAPYMTITSTSYGVQFNLPLFAGFAINSKVREAISLEDKARADLDTAVRTAALSARTAYLGVQSGLSQVRALEAAEISSNSALESNRLGYEVGVRINIDVLNAQQQLYSTRRDLAKARYDTMVNGLKLKAVAGSLAEADLAQLNALLEAR